MTQPNSPQKQAKKKPFDWLLFIIYWGVFVADLNYSSIAPFFDEKADKAGVSLMLQGFIFGSYSIGMFVTTFVVSAMMQGKGRKKLFTILGLFVQAVGLAIFLLLGFIEDEVGFVIISFVARIVTGAGQGIFNAPVYSMLPILYRDTLEDKIAMIEAISGFGFSVGPLIGGSLYGLGGWYLPFGVLIFLSLINVPLCFKHIPAVIKSNRNANRGEEVIYDVRRDDAHNHQIGEGTHLRADDEASGERPTIQAADKATYMQSTSDKDSIMDAIDCAQHQYAGAEAQHQLAVAIAQTTGELARHKDSNSKAGQENEEDEEDEDEVEEMSIGYTELFKDHHIVFAYFSVIFVNSNQGFLDPTLANWIDRNYGKGATFTGIVFFAGSLVYICLCPLGSFLTKKSKSLKVLLFFGCFVSALGMLSIGPSHMFTGLPNGRNDWWVLFFAQALLGIGNTFVFIPVIPDMIDSLMRRYPNIPEELIGDLSSSLFNSSFSLGVFVGPVVSGILVDAFGGFFPNAAAIMAFALLGFCIVYLIFGGVVNVKKFVPPKKEDDITTPIAAQPEKQKVSSRPQHRMRTFSAAGRSMRGSIIASVRDMRNNAEANGNDLLQDLEFSVGENSRRNSIDWEIKSDQKKVVSFRVRSRSRSGSTYSLNFSRRGSLMSDPLLMQNAAQKHQ